jgi:hypothetical protein
MLSNIYGWIGRRVEDMTNKLDSHWSSNKLRLAGMGKWYFFIRDVTAIFG